MCIISFAHTAYIVMAINCAYILYQRELSNIFCAEYDYMYYMYNYVCRQAEAIKRGKFKLSVMFGEMSTVPLEQLTTIVDAVR